MYFLAALAIHIIQRSYGFIIASHDRCADEGHLASIWLIRIMHATQY